MNSRKKNDENTLKGIFYTVKSKPGSSWLYRLCWSGDTIVLNPVSGKWLNCKGKRDEGKLIYDLSTCVELSLPDNLKDVLSKIDGYIN